VRLIEDVFPQFNRHESLAVQALSEGEQLELARLLRIVLARIQDVDAPDGAAAQ